MFGRRSYINETQPSLPWSHVIILPLNNGFITSITIRTLMKFPPLISAASFGFEIVPKVSLRLTVASNVNREKGRLWIGA